MLRRYGIAVCAIVILVLSTACTCAPDKKQEIDIWRVLKGYDLGSVAWSPKGDRIAFTAGSCRDETDFGLERASIWVMSAPKQGDPTRLRRLAMLTREQGMPTTLFWLDNDRIGWATQGGINYTFMQMRLDDKNPRRLVDRTFTGYACTDCMGSRPGDVYYDTGSETLLFSGNLAPTGVYVRALPLSSKKVRNLSVPHPAGVVYPHGYLDHVAICGSLRDPQKPVFYLSAAAVVMDEKQTGDGWYLWRSDSYSLRHDKIIAGPNVITAFPRTSPDGESLAYIRYVGDGTRQEIIFHELESGKERTLATITSSDGCSPNGCPYSWSPDGKQIAYSDGSRIKIVQVDAKQSGGNR